jgi:hypothetical protein
MLVNTTTEVVKFMGVWVRRADAGLARSAALNAAHSVDAARSRQLDDARTMRDLAKIPAASRSDQVRRAHSRQISN